MLLSPIARTVFLRVAPGVSFGPARRTLTSGAAGFDSSILPIFYSYPLGELFERVSSGAVFSIAFHSEPEREVPCAQM